MKNEEELKKHLM